MQLAVCGREERAHLWGDEAASDAKPGEAMQAAVRRGLFISSLHRRDWTSAWLSCFRRMRKRGAAAVQQRTGAHCEDPETQ